MLEELILVFIVAFGLITSYDDIRFNRIKNKWVLLAIAFGVLVSIIIHFLNPSQTTPTGLPYLAEFYLNVLCTFVLGYILWYTGLWSAGDAKLFLAYALLIPITTYQFALFPHFPSYTLLVNTFTPFLLFFIIFVLIRIKKAMNPGLLKWTFQPMLLLTIALFLFGFGWVVTALFNLIGVPSNAILQVVSLFTIILVSSRYLKFRLLAVSVVLCILRVIFDFKNYASLEYLWNFILVMVLLLILRFYLLTLSYEVFSKDIFIESLKRGMIPAEDVYKVAKVHFRKRRFAYFSFLEALLRKSQETSLFNRLGDGLTDNEVAMVKKAHSRGYLREHTIRIYQTLPFAPFMFVGAMLTLFLKTDIAMFVRIIIESFI